MARHGKRSSAKASGIGAVRYMRNKGHHGSVGRSMGHKGKRK